MSSIMWLLLFLLRRRRLSLFILFISIMWRIWLISIIVVSTSTTTSLFLIMWSFFVVFLRCDWRRVIRIITRFSWDGETLILASASASTFIKRIWMWVIMSTLMLIFFSFLNFYTSQKIIITLIVWIFFIFLSLQVSIILINFYLI